LVLELRNRCPEELLPWIDAAVVLAGDDPVFPPLLGTGGNDGCLDFSTNFHQSLLDVIGTPRSAALARDLVNGTETEQLANAPIGQFDPGSAGGPGSSKFGSAMTLVNPWGYVLLIEGALLFASSAVRRNQFAASRAAMPFTVFGSPDGSDSGAAGEESRGEVWAPLWRQDCTLAEIRQLFADARASWRGRPARRAADFYAAELHYRDKPIAMVSRVEPGSGTTDRWTSEFRRHRINERRTHSRPGAGLRLQFTEEIEGPLLLGQLSHFGYGIFVLDDGP
jgi:CRISPR-associated protein Csx17